MQKHRARNALTRLFPAVLVLLAGSLVTAPPGNAVEIGYIEVALNGYSFTEGAWNPLVGASVSLYPPNEVNPGDDPNWEPNAYASDTTDATGVATFPVPDTGPSNFKVKAWKVGWGHDWHPSGTNSTYASGNQVLVTGSDTTHVNINLYQQVQRYTVQAWDLGTGAGVPGATVALYAAGGSGSSPAYSSSTDSGGDAKWLWALADAPSGQYRVRVSAPGYGTEWVRVDDVPNDFEHAMDLDPVGDLSVALTPGTAVVGPTPTITGTPRVGLSLQAHTGAWFPATTEFTYRWLRGATVIPGATAPTYVVTAADRGQRLRVRVAGEAAGFDSLTRDSAQTAIVQAGRFTSAPTPKLVGKAVKGRTLTALPGSWRPAPAKLAYQWFRGSKPIPGATKPKYLLSANDVGKRLRVRVTATRPGYQKTARVSALSKRVAR